MGRRVFVVVLAVVSLAMAEDKTKSKRGFEVDCKKFNNVAACRSFDELVASKDKNLLMMLQLGSSFVCFRDTEDTFILLTYSEPTLYQTDSENGGISTQGTVRYITFKNGLQDLLLPISGQWNKLGTNDVPIFLSRPDEIKALINDTEVSFSYPFKNLSHTSTHYEFRIRRSTLRFAEFYSAEGAKKESAIPTTQGGHCEEFKEPR